MILRVEQLSKDLFTASFQIMYGDTKVGEMYFQGSIASMEGAWSGYVFNRNVVMSKVFNLKGVKDFRAYSINIDGAPCGNVYQTEYKEGPFKPKIYYHHIDINGLIADIFPIGCGETVNSPVYMNGEQKALVEKSLTVCDDLHFFDVYALDDNSAFLTVLLCLYMYTIGYYKAGEKPIKTVYKGYFLETEKDLLAKHDPEFKKKYFGL